jgi:hypothetical protein
MRVDDGWSIACQVLPGGGRQRRREAGSSATPPERINTSTLIVKEGTAKGGAAIWRRWSLRAAPRAEITGWLM